MGRFRGGVRGNFRRNLFIMNSIVRYKIFSHYKLIDEVKQCMRLKNYSATLYLKFNCTYELYLISISCGKFF